MFDFLSSSHPILRKVVASIEENLADEHFGVTELADQLNMSRSNLLRIIKKETGLSVSVLIRQVRLHHAEQMLAEGLLTASEISYKVGFNSTSYFTKCFREQYGYPPGEHKMRGSEDTEEIAVVHDVQQGNRKAQVINTVILLTGLILIASLGFVYLAGDKAPQKSPPKSIAVLPFKNDSSDSTNVYFMNGLMDAILGNFRKIENIQVTSRTTVERYRNVSKSISEISNELDVKYLVEGSGQKIGNQILLNVQLIDGSTDQQIWSQSYKREFEDIFELQRQVAEQIAVEIGAAITPDERERIEKIPTQNLVAYDYYLRGLEFVNDQTGAGLFPAIEMFKKAIQEDGEFAQAYAYVALSYYYLDLYVADKQYTEQIKNYAEKAIMLDDELGESYIAQALYQMQLGEYEQAVVYYEKVLEYYPNAGWIHNSLSNIYMSNLPNTEKYLKHAIQGIQMTVLDEDSITASYTYLHLSNALIQNGFIVESEKYVKRSLDYNPDNIFSECLYAYIRMAQDFDLGATKNSLKQTLQKDTSRLDVLQEIGKVCYTMGDYQEALYYYRKMIEMEKAMHISVYRNVDINIAFTLQELGKSEEAKEYYESFLEFAENDKSIYRELCFSAYYAATGDIKEAMSHLKLFAEKDNYQYWIMLFLDKDPVILRMSGHPDFTKTMNKIRDKFWMKHMEMRKMLEAEEVI